MRFRIFNLESSNKCTKEERQFLDELKENFTKGCINNQRCIFYSSGWGKPGVEYSMILQKEFKTNLVNLIGEPK